MVRNPLPDVRPRAKMVGQARENVRPRLLVYVGSSPDRLRPRCLAGQPGQRSRGPLRAGGGQVLQPPPLVLLVAAADLGRLPPPDPRRRRGGGPDLLPDLAPRLGRVPGDRSYKSGKPIFLGILDPGRRLRREPAPRQAFTSGVCSQNSSTTFWVRLLRVSHRAK